MISSFNSIYCFLATYQTAMSPACMELILVGGDMINIYTCHLGQLL